MPEAEVIFSSSDQEQSKVLPLIFIQMIPVIQSSASCKKKKNVSGQDEVNLKSYSWHGYL